MRTITGLAAQSQRLDYLDAMRGCAIFGVVLVHSGYAAYHRDIAHAIASGGQYGVQLFFIVSALTISITYQSHVAQFGRSGRSQLAWLIKRFFRIAPLYYLAIPFYLLEQCIVVALGHHQLTPWLDHYQLGASQRMLAITANLLFVHTWIASANNSVVPGGWSIGVEMCFYTLVPLIWLVEPVERRVRTLAIAVVACLIVSPLVAKLGSGSFNIENDTFLYFWFPTQTPVMLTGLIFYFMRGAALQERRGVKTVASFAGFLLYLTSGVYIGNTNGIGPAIAPTITGISFILLLGSLHGIIRRLLVNRYTIFLGKISFSVYIFHFATLDFIVICFRAAGFREPGALTVLPVFVAALALTAGIALASKRMIEDPAIAYGHQLSRRVATGASRARLAKPGSTALEGEG